MIKCTGKIFNFSKISNKSILSSFMCTIQLILLYYKFAGNWLKAFPSIMFRTVAACNGTRELSMTNILLFLLLGQCLHFFMVKECSWKKFFKKELREIFQDQLKFWKRTDNFKCFLLNFEKVPALTLWVPGSFLPAGH